MHYMNPKWMQESPCLQNDTDIVLRNLQPTQTIVIISLAKLFG